jgi:hypothetical protein
LRECLIAAVLVTELVANIFTGKHSS